MLKLAPLFSHHCVLQRNKHIAVFGTCDSPSVTAEINGCKTSAAVCDGKFLLTLPPMQAGGPYEMTVTDGTETITLTDVMIGEVWLCGGQSNMELELHSAKGGEELLRTLTPDLPVRFYYTPKQRMVDENLFAAEANCGWNTASPEGSRAWSAVGFHFAKIMSERLGITIGLIGCNWGGTSATAWMSRERIENIRELSPYLESYDQAMAGKTLEEHIAEYDAYLEYSEAWNKKYEEFQKLHPNGTWDEAQEYCGVNKFPGPMGPKNEYRPGGLYETMLQRVCPYTLAGVLYYQGESDDHQPQLYYRLLSEMILQWRADWNDDQLPFLLVQLPMFQYAYAPDYKHWCKIREAQQRVADTIQNTELAVILDCGEFDNIHPTDKFPVGQRLANLALKRYGLCDSLTADAPMYDSYTVNGETMTITLKNAPDGLIAKGSPLGFELAGADKQFVPAEAEFDGAQVHLRANGVAQPVYARYAWTNYMEVQVFGRNGLPLAPFRTARNDEA